MDDHSLCRGVVEMPEDCPGCPAKHALTEDVIALKTNYSWMRKALESIQESTKEIAESSRAMVRLEMEAIELKSSLARSFNAIEREESERVQADHDIANKVEAVFNRIESRLTEIEREMPTLTLARTCVFAVIAMAATNFAGLVWMLLKTGAL